VLRGDICVTMLISRPTANKPMKMEKSKAGRSLTAGQLLGIGVLLILFWAIVLPMIQQNLGVIPGGGGTQTQTAGLIDVTKPIRFAVMDEYAGSAVSSATVQIYRGTSPVETLTTGSDGTVTSALTYRSGESLNVYITKGSSKYWAAVTVPKMSPADAQSLSYNPVTVKTFTVGTYTITVVRSTGASLSSGGTFDFTAAGVTQESFTVSVFNTADNTGYLTSTNPIDNRKLGAFLEVSITGTNYDKFLVSGLPGYRTTGSGNTWTRPVSDSEISRVKVGTTVVKPGSFSVVVTVDSSPASSGNTATMTIRLNLFADEQRFLTIGDKGADAVVAATFTLTLEK
jgi:hypothetical protein